MTELPVWRHDVGQIPNKVTVLELVNRSRQLFLRWRSGGNWKHEQLRQDGEPVTLRTKNGRIKETVQRWAIDQAKRKHEALEKGAGRTATIERPLTIAEGLALATNPERGKYGTDTPHRRELLRSLQHAIRVLGSDRTWDSLTNADLRELWRDRIRALQARGQVGHRSAVIVIRDLLAVAGWLRGEKKIPATAAVFDGKLWKAELVKDWRQLSGSHRDPEPQRPRHSLDEMRRILAVAPSVDPRLGLALAIGAEVRLGQVLRARRTDLDRTAGEITVWGAGHKQGTVIELTPKQLADLETALTTGYLRHLEAAYQADGTDYPLFPGGRLAETRVGPSGRSKFGSAFDPARGVALAKHAAAAPIDEQRVGEWFHEAERRAGVPQVKGRRWYGLRRVAVDAASEEEISPEAMKEHGGWADMQMVEKIYRSKKRKKARREAARVRARIRGESA